MEQVKALIQQSQQGDEKAREKLVKENAGLVWNVVGRFQNRGQEREDLFQIGCIGLLKAIDRFDQSFDVRFSTYAVPMIIGEIKRFLRDDGLIKVSRSLKELAVRAKRLQETIELQSGKTPTMEELAGSLQVEREELAEALGSSCEVESIYKTIYQNDGNAICLLDKLESENKEQERLLDRMALRSAIRQLEPFEQKIIILRYYSGQTQVEIAKTIGISQVQVSRIEKKVLIKMKKILEKERD